MKTCIWSSPRGLSFWPWVEAPLVTCYLVLFRFMEDLYLAVAPDPFQPDLAEVSL